MKIPELISGRPSCSVIQDQDILQMLYNKEIENEKQFKYIISDTINQVAFNDTNDNSKYLSSGITLISNFVINKYRKLKMILKFISKNFYNFRFKITFTDNQVKYQSFYPEYVIISSKLEKQCQTDEIKLQNTIMQTGNPKNQEIQVTQPLQIYQKNDKCDINIIDNLILLTQQYINKTVQQRKILNGYLQNEQKSIVQQQLKYQTIQLQSYLQKCQSIKQLYIFGSYILVFYEDTQKQIHSMIGTFSNIKELHELDIELQYIIKDPYIAQLNKSFLLVNVQPDTFLLVSTNTYQIYQKFQIQQIQNKIILIEKLQRQNTLIAVTNSNEIFVFSLTLNQQKKFDVKIESEHQISRKKYGDILNVQLISSNNIQFTILITTCQDIQEIQLQIQSQVGQKIIQQQKQASSTFSKALLLDNSLYKNLSTHRSILLSQIMVVLTADQNITVQNKNSRLFNFGTQKLINDFVLYNTIVITLQGYNQIVVYNLLGQQVQQIEINDRFEKIYIISQNYEYIRIALINDKKEMYQVLINSQIVNTDFILQQLYKQQLE